MAYCSQEHLTASKSVLGAVKEGSAEVAESHRVEVPRVAALEPPYFKVGGERALELSPAQPESTCLVLFVRSARVQGQSEASPTQRQRISSDGDNRPLRLIFFTHVSAGEGRKR